MACATYHAAPPYPTVVAVKLSTISAPNGVAGLCGRSGLIASARKPDGLPKEPRLIAHDDGCRRRESQVLEEQKEDEQKPGHHQEVEMRLQQVLRIGKALLDEP